MTIRRKPDRTELQGVTKKSIFSLALEARTHWAMHRVNVSAGENSAANADLHFAIHYAKSCGSLSLSMSSLEDVDIRCPALLVDVPTLREAFSAVVEPVCSRRRKLRTREGIEAELDMIASEENKGCGLSFELFVKRFSDAVDDFLDEIDEAWVAVALEIAKSQGYATPAERDEMQEAIEASGGCPLTGIDPWCCPCGRHE